MTKTIVYYCYLTNKYEQLIDKQFQRIVDSDLYKHVDEIYVNICGDEKLINKQIEWFKKFDKVKIYSTNSTENIYEYQGLKCVYDIAQLKDEHDDNYILYLHTKGITRGCSLDMEIWRNCMEHELVDKWENAISYCTKDRAVGINLKHQPKWHFSGNMWWATVGHIKKLVEPRVVMDDSYKEFGITNRHYYEFWISHFRKQKDNIDTMHNLKRYNIGYHLYPEYNFLNKKYFVC